MQFSREVTEPWEQEAIYIVIVDTAFVYPVILGMAGGSNIPQASLVTEDGCRMGGLACLGSTLGGLVTGNRKQARDLCSFS